MRSQRTTPPRCERHPGSTVSFDGSYGTAARRRRRYRCRPANGEPSHRFSEPLPRQGAGAASPRLFTYTTAEIADALVAVGRGTSYRGAAPRADGNSVADWVEIFAPVVFARSAPASWPRTVVIDSLPFRVRLPRDIPAFQIFGALDPEAGLVSLQAFPGAHPGAATALWEEFLRSREDVPSQVVCDPDPDLLAAIENVWTPAPATVLCHSHLRVELRDLLREEGINRGEPIANAGERAFDGPVQWHEFVEFHRPRRLRKLERWVARHDERIGRQLDRAEPSDKTTDLLEQKLVLLGDLFSGRRGNLRNRERTNRLLMLVQLELNGLADRKRYARTIEEELLARGGRADPRRAIVDPTGSSLRP